MLISRFIADVRRVLTCGSSCAADPAGSLTRALELVVDAPQVYNVVTSYTRELYGARQAAMLLADPHTGRLEAVSRQGWAVAEPLRLPADGRLARWLQVNQTSLWPRRQPAVVEYLSAAERELLLGLEVELCIPLTAMSRLIAIIVLSGLGSRRPSELSRQLVAQIGLAVQNATLFAQQQLRLRRMARAERLATTGELAASAAHEIRNPLTAISSAVQLLGEAFPPGNERRQIADSVMREIDRINQIVEGLLAFGRPPDPKRAQVNLSQVLAEAVQLVRPMAAKARVVVAEDYRADRDALEADRDQLTEVFVNLLLNSVQAMPDGGTLTVSLTRPRRFRVEVADTGTGMTADQAERAFDPFYTTKAQGTGLGLPICYGIVRSHGGEIDIESRPGVGTVVRVEL